MKKLTSLVAALVMVPVLFASAPVYADSPGQLSNGATNYKVRNVTTNGAYGQTITAACNDTVKYSVTVSNSDFGKLTNVTVKANLASGAINASATTATSTTTSVSGTATVSTTGTLEYVTGSTVRYEEDATTMTAKADGVTGAGVNVGDLNGSTAIFVQWQAKVKCDTTTPVTIQVCDLTTKKVITIKETDFNSAKHSKDLTKCNAATTTTTLVKTGPADTAAIVAGVVALATVAYAWVLRRQNAR